MEMEAASCSLEVEEERLSQGSVMGREAGDREEKEREMRVRQDTSRHTHTHTQRVSWEEEGEEERGIRHRD